MRAFYTDTIDEIDAYYRVFENLQADLFPKIFANCKNLGLKLPESYFRSMFIEQVPFETCCRLWDQVSPCQPQKGTILTIDHTGWRWVHFPRSIGHLWLLGTKIALSR